MGSVEEIAKVLMSLKSVPLEDRRPLVDQVNEFKNILQRAENAPNLEALLRLGRRYNSAAYMLEFAMAEIDNEDLMMRVAGLENTLDDHLCNLLLAQAKQEGLDLTANGKQLSSLHLADLIRECDRRLNQGKKAA